jgi:hypothetical protein
MRKYFSIVVIMGLLAVLVGGCAEKQVKAKDPLQQEFVQFLAEMEKAWNAQDAQKYLTFWHEDLKLKLGRPGAVKYYDKKEYAKVLPQRMKDMGPFKLVDPELVDLKGDTAKLKINVRKSNRDYPQTWLLKRSNSRWQIISNEW